MIIKSKAIIRRLFKQIGYDIFRRQVDLVDFLNRYQINTVIDVGANIGQFGNYLRNYGYKNRIISFEPVSSVFKQLEKTARDDRLWDIFNLGIGDYDGNATINIYPVSCLNSMLKAMPILATPQGTEIININKLDSIIGRFYREGVNMFLKVDTQGYEKEVIMGAINSLRKFQGVSLELSPIGLYEGQASFIDMIILMENNGFKLALIEPVGYFRDKALMRDADCIFINNNLL